MGGTVTVSPSPRARTITTTVFTDADRPIFFSRRCRREKENIAWGRQRRSHTTPPKQDIDLAAQGAGLHLTAGEGLFPPAARRLAAGRLAGGHRRRQEEEADSAHGLHRTATRRATSCSIGFRRRRAERDLELMTRQTSTDLSGGPTTKATGVIDYNQKELRGFLRQGARSGRGRQEGDVAARPSARRRAWCSANTTGRRSDAGIRRAARQTDAAKGRRATP